MAYLDGNADQATESHFKKCPHCRQKAENLDRFQKRLAHRLYRLSCPSTIELGEYHLRMLTAPQMLVVGQHVRECPHCAQEVSQLESFLSDPASSSTGSLLGRAKVLIAQLVGGQTGGSALSPAFTALRGEAKGPMTFAADGIVIVLDMQPVPEGKANILGQVAADNQDDWTGALVELRQDGLLQISSTVDDLGGFQCQGVMPGQYELRITPKNDPVVVISNFEVHT